MADYDVIFVGTGFATSFFLSKWLERHRRCSRACPRARGRSSHRWQLDHRRNSGTNAADTFVNETPAKGWGFNIGFGGSSNCWTAGTSRLMPVDFRMASEYGVGRDWPISYSDLEPYYDAAERMMSVSGPPTTMSCSPAPLPFLSHRTSSAVPTCVSRRPSPTRSSSSLRHGRDMPPPFDRAAVETWSAVYVRPTQSSRSITNCDISMPRTRA